jgi:general secretion pathway protein E
MKPAPRHGVPGLPLTSTVIGVSARRLVRTLVRTAEAHSALPEIVEQMRPRPVHRRERKLYRRSAVRECAQHRLRKADQIMEMLPITDPLRSLVMKHASQTELRNQAASEGMLTMYEDGLRKAVRGITTFEEVLRVTREG